jgi:hypothetical protein
MTRVLTALVSMAQASIEMLRVLVLLVNAAVHSLIGEPSVLNVRTTRIVLLSTQKPVPSFLILLASITT